MSESLNNNELDKILSPKEVDAIFEEAKGAELDEVGYLIDRGLDKRLTLAIKSAGTQHYHQFVKEIWRYLKSRDEYLMTEAILALGCKSRLHIPEFRDVAYDIWKNYKEQNEFSCMKRIASSIWFSYYENTNSQEALTILYKILTENSVVDMRLQAYVGILVVCDDPGDLAEINNQQEEMSHEGINQKVDWECLNKLMEMHAPEVRLVDPDQIRRFGIVYTREYFARELKNRMQQGQAAEEIGAWAYKVYFFYLGKLDSDFEQMLKALAVMEEGPGFAFTYEELNQIADDLLAGKDVKL